MLISNPKGTDDDDDDDDEVDDDDDVDDVTKSNIFVHRRYC